MLQLTLTLKSGVTRVSSRLLNKSQYHAAQSNEAIAVVLDAVHTRQVATLSNLRSDACSLSDPVAASGEDASATTAAWKALRVSSRVEASSLISDVVSSVATFVDQKQDLVGTSLEGRDFVGVDFSLQRLSASFNRADLTHTKWSGCSLRKCTFNAAVLTHSEFLEAAVHSCTFIGSEIVEADLRRAKFANCVFHRCDFRGAKVDAALFLNCEFKNCDLTGWTFDGQTTLVKPMYWHTSRCNNWKQSPESRKRFGTQSFQLHTSTPAMHR